MKLHGTSFPHPRGEIEISVYELERIIDCFAELGGRRNLLQDEVNVFESAKEMRNQLRYKALKNAERIVHGKEE